MIDVIVFCNREKDKENISRGSSGYLYWNGIEEYFHPQNKKKSSADVICACGPMPMLRGVKAYGLENEIETYVSMEERMACGIGACLGCVCQSTEVDSHSNVHNKRVCKDGPVFLSTEVEL